MNRNRIAMTALFAVVVAGCVHLRASAQSSQPHPRVIVVGVNGTAQPAFRGFPAEHPGTNRQLQVTRNCSAVSSACILTRREVFEQVGGFDEKLSGLLADVDLCLKMRRAGYLIVYTPFAKLYWHAVQPDNVDAKGETILRQRWADVLECDPYYNPNLSRERADFSLEVPP